jgi:MFS family permease
MKQITTLDDPREQLAPDQQRYQRMLLLVIMLSVMAFGSLMTIVTVSLDLIATDLNSSVSTITWTITGLMVAVAVTTPIGGKLGDLYGNRPMLLIGLAGGVVTTVLCSLAWDAPSLIAFRVLFGVFGGLVNPNAMSLMIHAYGVERRATALGWFNFAMTGSPVIGVVVSGPLIDSQGWRPVFAGFAAVSALALVVAWFVARPTPTQDDVKLDLLGAATLALAVLAGLLTITSFLGSYRTDGWGSAFSNPVALGLALLCGVGVRLFIVAERRSEAPLLKLAYFGRRNFTLPMVAAALMQFAYMGGFVVTPRLLDKGYGWTVGAAALLIAFRPLAFSLASILGGKAPSVLGLRPPIVMGTLLMIASMVAFTGASFLTSLNGIGLIAAGLVLSGVASGVSMPSVAATMVGSVDKSDMGIAVGMNQQMTMIGIVCGIQTMSVLLGDTASATPARFATTYGFGGLIAIGSLACALMIRSQSVNDRAVETTAPDPVPAPAPTRAVTTA